jgi:hypothetical protein
MVARAIGLIISEEKNDIIMIISDMHEKEHFGEACCLHFYFSGYILGTTPNMEVAKLHQNSRNNTTSPHGVIFQQTDIFMNTAVRTSQINFCCSFRQGFLLQPNGSDTCLIRIKKSRIASKYKLYPS